MDIVLECSGRWRTTETLEPHLAAGARRVIVAAPVKDGVPNIVMGCNEEAYDPVADQILTAASCTTNCLAPVVKVIHESFGIEHGVITTIHDVTNTQVVVDAPHRDLRRARSALNALIPTSTGSATAITMIYPELAGRLDGIAVRVPLLNASLVDAVFTCEKSVTVESVNNALARRQRGTPRRDSRVRDPPAGLDGLRERSSVGRDRRSEHDGRRRSNGQDPRVVRQRVRICIPSGRSRVTDRSTDGSGRRMNLRGYALVTIAYWALTITDGAMRMLVLLHFHELGYGPVTLGFLFVGYEACGIATNLLGGRLGQRYGLDRTLHLGLWLQVAALFALSMTEPTWAEAVSIAWVMGCQALSGVAKDLTKMSSKSAVKLIVKEERDGSHRSVLLRLVALLTGSKNALKGARLLRRRGASGLDRFRSCTARVGRDARGGVHRHPARLAYLAPSAKTGTKAAPSLVTLPRGQSTLGGPRLPLRGQGSVVRGRTPIFLAEDAGWSVEGIGAFMAIWVIGYGLVQAGAPWLQSKLVLGDRNSDESALARRWMLALISSPSESPGRASLRRQEAAVPVVVIGLLVFGIAFAVESALHSYLILAFASKDGCGPGRRLLLRGQRHRAAVRNAPVRRLLPHRRV